MQLSDIRTQVRYRYGIATAEAQATDAVLTALINAALRRLTLDRDWDWNTTTETISTVIGTESYARDATCRKTMRLVDTEYGRSLQFVTGNKGARYRNINGVPAFWWIEGGQLHLAPTPATARDYEHVFQKTETTLSGDTDTPTVPDWAIDAIIAMACLSLARRLGDKDKVRQFTDEVMAWQDSLADDARSAQPNPSRNTRRDWTRQAGL